MGSPVPWSRIRFAHTLPLAGASLIAGVRVVPCSAASWAGSSHSFRPFGPERWLPWPGIRPKGPAVAGSSGARRGGGGGSPPRRGPAPRPRGPPRRNARRGVPAPSKVCAKKSALRGAACRPAPRGGGRAARCPPWRFLRPRAYPPPSPPAVSAGGGRGRLWLPPPAAGPAPEEAGGGRGSPAPGPPAPFGVCAARFLSPAPCFLVACPGLAPLRPQLVLVGSRSRRRRAQGAPAARRGGRHLYRR